MSAASGGRRTANLAVVSQAFEAVGRGDVDAQLELFAEDAVLELPYADPPARLMGRPAIRSRLEPALRLFEIRIEITDVHDCADPDHLILEYTSRGRVTTTQRTYRNSYVGFFRLGEGLIRFQREYYNPIPGRVALAAD
ncbi:MAG: nuclear transport factor 2 family protein [Acidobacteriota bacterium]|nr:nuclear transport factor 2 family protein [Acidobacteriota bacterium]